MKSIEDRIVRLWTRLGPRLLPFADSASPEFPLSRLLRLSLFQVSVGMALVLLNGTLNRVMIVELAVPASLVALMISLPVLAAPARLLLGYRSDYHRSLLGWRRVPYIWFGSLIQFGGLAILPFALILLSGDSMAPPVFGQAAAALAFLLVGIGLHTTQTAGLALASDLAEPDKRHRVVALLYVTLLIGMLLASLSFSVLLADFSQVRLIQVIQGAAVVTMALNIIALWKQEARRPELTRPDAPRPSFASTLRQLRADRRQCRLLVAVALGTAGFSMQDVLLEPYGGEILGLSVGATTLLTALAAVGTLLGFALSARALDGGANPIRLAAYGLLAGVLAFTAVVFASPAGSANLFRLGAFLIGVGGGLFAVGTLTATMDQIRNEDGGRILGAWGAVQATAAGVAIGLSGFIRDVVGALATKGSLGAAMSTPASGYLVVYHIEIALMFLALVAIGPLVGHGHAVPRRATQFGLADHPG